MSPRHERIPEGGLGQLPHQNLQVRRIPSDLARASPQRDRQELKAEHHAAQDPAGH